MAFIHGREAEISVGGTDISAFCDAVDLSIDTNTETIRVLTTNPWQKQRPGETSATLSVSGMYDSTETTGPIDVLEALRFTPAEVIFYPQGNSTGRHKYTGQFFLTTLVTSAPVGGIVAFKATLLSHYDVTKAAV